MVTTRMMCIVVTKALAVRKSQKASLHIPSAHASIKKIEMRTQKIPNAQLNILFLVCSFTMRPSLLKNCCYNLVVTRIPGNQEEFNHSKSYHSCQLRKDFGVYISFFHLFAVTCRKQSLIILIFITIMRQSEIFSKTRKEAPKDELSKNGSLLVRGGFINKEMAGVYSYLPLGLLVLRKIENIIRKEINSIGGQEVWLSTLQDPTIWKKTGRWEDGVVDNWFKTELKNGTTLGIANTHEEPLTEMLKGHINSYKDLPVFIYQFQTKFRNELRAKSGILRGREFLMKDLYSFSRNEAEFKEFYEKCAESYLRIFSAVGIGHVTFRTVAAGGSFTSGFTDEFQTITDAGEDIIYVDQKKKIALNKEVYTDENIKKFGLKKSDLVEKKAIEVGNIFPLGTRYTEALGLRFKDEKGVETPIVMGSYGIGLGRLMGTVVEVLSDEKGIVWPESIAPFQIHLIEIAGKGEKVTAEALKVLKEFENNGFEVLHDDRKVSAGEKLSDSDLLGIPWRIVISEKMLAENKLELKNRKSGEIKITNLSEVIKMIQNG